MTESHLEPIPPSTRRKTLEANVLRFFVDEWRQYYSPEADTEALMPAVLATVCEKNSLAPDELGDLNKVALEMVKTEVAFIVQDEVAYQSTDNE